MGIDLSESEPKKIRQGSKYLNLCKFGEIEEVIQIVHQGKDEVQKEETHKLHQILKEVELLKKIP